MKKAKQVDNKSAIQQRNWLLRLLSKLFNIEFVSFPEFIRRLGRGLKNRMKNIKQIDFKKFLKLTNSSIVPKLETIDNKSVLTANIEPQLSPITTKPQTTQTITTDTKKQKSAMLMMAEKTIKNCTAKAPSHSTVHSLTNN